MSLFYRIWGWLVDKSFPPDSSRFLPIPPEAPTIFKNLHAYPRTRDRFLTADSRVTRRISMRYAPMVVVLACAITPSLSQETAEGPSNEKAQKTYKEV
jgi:hypothetical protein